jgi:hypothetical protein
LNCVLVPLVGALGTDPEVSVCVCKFGAAFWTFWFSHELISILSAAAVNLNYQ